MFNEEAYVERAVARRARSSAGPPTTTRSSSWTTPPPTRTAALADALARADPRVRVVHNPVNLQAGRRAARRATRRPPRTSSSTPTPTCPSTSRSCRGRCACSSTSRRTWWPPTASTARRRAWLRAVYTFCLQPPHPRSCSACKVRDVNFAFKLFRRSVLAEVPPEERGQLHRRGVPAPRAQGRLPDHPDRARLLPAHPRAVHPRLLRGDRGACCARWPRTGTTSASDAAAGGGAGRDPRGRRPRCASSASTGACATRPTATRAPSS